MLRPLRLLGAAALLGSSCGDPAGGTQDPSLIQTVERADLSITVRERAEVQAATDTRVVSQLEGRATLIYLIPEGTVVEQGQKVAELDASSVAERRASQAIVVARADAMLRQKRKSFEIMEKELHAAEKTAETRLQISRMQIEKFLGERRRSDSGDAAGLTAGTNRALLAKLRELATGASADEAAVHVDPLNLIARIEELLGSAANLDLAMGEMANQVLQRVDEISLANADLQMAKDTLGHSRRLEAKGFITKNELDRDEISYQRQLSKVTVAWNNLQLLIKYSLPETLITLEREAENAELQLESVKAASEARRVEDTANLESSQAEYDLARERLENWDLQIKNAVIHAPNAGLVVYGRYDWDEPVYEGMEVRERQEIIVLPNISKMVAEIKVHEAQIDKVAVGQTAQIKVDAFPERNFSGRVSRVSSLPDPNPRNRDLKVFGVMVTIDQDNRDGTLRPGMNATVIVDVGTIRDVVQVPLPAIERSGDDYFVWRATPDGPRAARVLLGSNNLTHVEIVAGLMHGDRIHLVRPAGAQLPTPPATPTSPPAGEDLGLEPMAIEASSGVERTPELSNESGGSR